MNICVMVQSVAQLDKIYGEHDRRIIFDNCQFQVILRANDTDTQKYLSELIGTRICGRHSIGAHINGDLCITDFSEQVSENRELCVQPHELATLNDVLLLSPYGFKRVKKFRLHNRNMKSILLNTPKVIRTPVDEVKNTEGCIASNDSKMNEGAKTMSIEERTANAQKKAQDEVRKRKQEEHTAKQTQKRKDQRRNCVIGELVTKYFPSVREYEPGTSDENQTRFEALEAFLCVLSTDQDLVNELQKRAAQLVKDAPDGEWRSPM